MKRINFITQFLVLLLSFFAAISFSDSGPPQVIFENFSEVPPFGWEIQNENSMSQWDLGIGPNSYYPGAAVVEHEGFGNYNTILFGNMEAYFKCDEYKYYNIILQVYKILPDTTLDSCMLTIETNQVFDGKNRKWNILDSIATLDMREYSTHWYVGYDFTFDKTATEGFENNQPFELGFRYSGLDCPYIAIDTLYLTCFDKIADDDDDNDDNDDDDNDDDDNDNDTSPEDNSSDDDDDDGCCGC